MSAPGPGGLTRRLLRLTGERAPAPADLRAAERYVRDWLGSLAAGRRAAAGRPLARYAAGARDLEARVFVAAALSHVTETDDLHRASVTHPGCVVIPVAWLLTGEGGGRGRALLEAVLVGYEVMIRVGESLGPGHYRRFHNTSTAGVFGAAAAAAHLLALDEDARVWALGNAGTQAAGLWQFNVEGAMTKPLHPGHAAAAGVRAALLAREGFTGAEEILEGERGLFAAMCPDPRPEALLEAADGWKLPETSLKPWPCCRHVHPGIDAALEIREALERGGEEGGSDATPLTDEARLEAIREVRVETYPAALGVTDRPSPRTPHEARFSLQWAVATTLVRGWPGPGAFAPEALEDPVVRALLDRVRVEVSPSLEAAYPERWGAAVEVVGQRTWRAERPSAAGDPEAPLDDETLDRKVLGLLAAGGVEAGAARALLDACRDLPDDGPLPALPLP